MTSRRLVLIGGSAGSGKTTVAQTLAAELGAGWLQLDTVWLALKAAAGPGTAAYDVLDVDGRMRRGGDSDEALLAAHIAASEAVCRALPGALGFELNTHPTLVADGSWLLPAFVAALSWPDTEVGYVCLQHDDVDGVEAALSSRLEGRAPEERHVRMNRQIWQYGDWVAQQARDHGLPVLDPLPFATLLPRVRAALSL